jgi:hypothetical protein
MREFALNFAFAISALLAFLVPIGFYCLIIGSINRRPRPLMVSGVWDAVGLLFAVSGFFLATMPMLMSVFYMRAYDAAPDEILGLWMSQWAMWLVYFLFLISGAALMILWRWHKTMIYNVDAELFPKVLDQALARAGVGSAADHGRLVLTPLPRTENVESTAVTAAPPTPAPPVAAPTRCAELQVDSFASLCHVTLHWDNYAPEVRQQIERELDKCLEGAAPLENPSTGWFLNISGMIFGTLLMVIVAVIILMVFGRR